MNLHISSSDIYVYLRTILDFMGTDLHIACLLHKYIACTMDASGFAAASKSAMSKREPTAFELLRTGGATG